MQQQGLLTPSSGRQARFYERIVHGLDDFTSGLANWRLCHLMGVSELRRRYARSRLGQFWLTISMGVMVAALGLMWATLWKMPVAEMLPHVAVGLVVWALINGVLSEAATVFVGVGPMFLNQGMRFSTAILALVYRHLLIFAHNAVILIVVFGWFQKPIGLSSTAALAGLLLLVITLTWCSYLVAIACTRFRDLTQVVSNFLLVAFFLTPVLWKEDSLSVGHQWIVALNPFALFLSLIRDPLFNQVPSASSWVAAISVAGVGLILAIPAIGHTRNRIIYWV